ncbi:MAG: AAA family ATPase [Syntrophobacteraceae bacterium]
MRSLRVQNLRSILDSGRVEIKPITLLVGKNGSGKSTFARLFPLLRQSIESRTRGPVLWFGEYIDFGGFSNAVRVRSQEREIILEFAHRMNFQERHRRPSMFRSPIDTTISMTLAFDSREDKTFIKHLYLRLNDDICTIDANSSGVVTRLQCNSTVLMDNPNDLLLSGVSCIIPHLESPESRHSQMLTLEYIRYYHYYDLPSASPFISISRPLFHKSASDHTIMKFFRSFKYSNINEFFANMKSFKEGGKVYAQHVASLSTYDSKVIQLRDSYIATLLPFLLSSLDDYFTNIAQQITYIGPVRATAQRFYRTQELAVDRIDYKGQNMAEFLRSLTEGEKNRFKKWTLENLDFEVHTKKIGDHIEIKLSEAGSKIDYNLADSGFGFSQILPIVAQLWAMIDRSRSTRGTPMIFYIEQPELHLHPNYQAKVADTLIISILESKKSELDIRLIVETHSETIVNRIGNQIAAGRLKNDDVNVVLFEKENPDSDTFLRFVSYDENGYLINWPYGFFEPDQG